MSGEIIVLVTCASDQGANLAQTLVEEKLAAGVNIIPQVQSVFYWEGKLCHYSEQFLIIESHQNLWQALLKRIKDLHSYEVPKIVCFPIQDGYKPYLEWLNSGLKIPA